MPRMRLLTMLGCLVAVAACGDGTTSGGQVGMVCVTAGNVCSTPTCSQFPTNPSCGQPAIPTNGYCPVDQYFCWDPTTAKEYCNPSTSACAAAKAGSTCPTSICSRSTLAQCATIPDDKAIFCVTGTNTTCTSFTCTTDGGTPGD